MTRFSRLLIGFLLATAGMGAYASSGSRTITFIQYDDLHAHLTPHKDLVADRANGPKATKIEDRGGMARAATLIKQIRNDNPNSILMMIGDTFHGGVEAQFSQGNAVADPLNALGIDVGVMGNWDFAYGPQVTRARYFEDKNLPFFLEQSKNGKSSMMDRFKRKIADKDGKIAKMMATNLPFDMKRPNYPSLAANVKLARNGKPMLPPFWIKDVNGIKIGLIGITSDIVPKMHEMLAIGLEFLDGEQNYVDLINQYSADLRKQGVQFVGVMSELGIHKNYRLAQLVTPGSVDVFFSAHTHEAVFNPLDSASGALVVESGNDGYIGRMDVTFKNGKVVGRNWKLNIINSSIAEDPHIADLVAKERAPFLVKDPNKTISTPFTTESLHQPIDSVIGHSNILLTRYNALESSFNNAYTDMTRAITKTQVAMTPAFRFGANIAVPGYMYEDRTIATGDITLEDAYRFFPVSYSISTAKVSVGNLRNVLEALLTEVYSTSAFKQAGGWVSGFSGIEVRLDLTKPDGSRIISIGDPVTHQVYSNDTVLSITGCTRPMDDADVLCSYHGYSDIKGVPNPVDGSAWTAVQIFVYGLQNGLLPNQTRQNFYDVSNTPTWPVSGFFEPLTGLGNAALNSDVPAPPPNMTPEEIEESKKPAMRKMMKKMREQMMQ